jgi:transposase
LPQFVFRTDNESDNTLLFFDHDGDIAAQSILYRIVCANPGVKETALVALCHMVRGMQHVTLQWVQKTISLVWRWSWRKPSQHSLARYDAPNVQRWANYVQLIRFVDWRRLKFVDESHCVSSALLSTRICAPRGVNVRVFDNFPNAARLNVILLTSIEHPNAPLFYTINDGTNDGFSFLQFVCDAVWSGYIGRGDIMVMDNSSVHRRRDMRPFLDDLFASVGSTYVYLPAYSPELNPCEFAFAHMKNWLRRNPSLQPLPRRLAQALAEVEIGDTLNYYKHCTSVYYQKLNGSN